MTLLDRFRAQPPLKHADPVVRLAYVEDIPVDERELLAEIAREDADARVRRAAVAKLLDIPALVAIAGNDADESVREEAVGMLREIGHLQGLAHALNNRGANRQHLGMVEEALPDHLEAHELAIELGDHCVAAYALTNIADAHRLAGRLDEARYHHDLATRSADQIADTDLRARLLRDKAFTARDGGDPHGALLLFQELLGVATDTGNRTHQGHGEIGVARTMHALGRHAEAAAHWDGAEAIYAELDQPEAEEVRAERAELTCACGQR